MNTRRLNKRDASYVPAWCREELHKLSKADLMEIAFDLATRAHGEDAGEMVAYEDIRQTSAVLARCAGRLEPRLRRGAELAASTTPCAQGGEK